MILADDPPALDISLALNTTTRPWYNIFSTSSVFNVSDALKIQRASRLTDVPRSLSARFDPNFAVLIDNDLCAKHYFRETAKTITGNSLTDLYFFELQYPLEWHDFSPYWPSTRIDAQEPIYWIVRLPPCETDFKVPRFHRSSEPTVAGLRKGAASEGRVAKLPG